MCEDSGPDMIDITEFARYKNLALSKDGEYIFTFEHRDVSEAEFFGLRLVIVSQEGFFFSLVKDVQYRGYLVKIVVESPNLQKKPKSSRQFKDMGMYLVSINNVSIRVESAKKI